MTRPSPLQTTAQALDPPAQADRPVMISVRQAGKVYKVYARQENRLWELVRRRPLHQQRWAVHDVTFDIHAGEVVGIIGRNGAGKTTLLRLISGVAPLDTGSIRVDASLQTILELGTGFHPEFTGRENVYLGGALLGLSRRDLATRFDEIAAFAELGDYLEFPFKTYSLGMQARLTFSLAISVEADILIVDEALSAGDSYFLAKCFDRIRTICESGKTVLLCRIISRSFSASAPASCGWTAGSSSPTVHRSRSAHSTRPQCASRKPSGWRRWLLGLHNPLWLKVARRVCPLQFLRSIRWCRPSGPVVQIEQARSTAPSLSTAAADTGPKKCGSSESKSSDRRDSQLTCSRAMSRLPYDCIM